MYKSFNWLISMVLWLGLVVSGSLIWTSSSYTVWYYLFLLRVPIFMGFFLAVILLLMSTFILPNLLRNLLVMRSSKQLASVILGTVMAALAVVLIANIILLNASSRFNLSSWVTIPEIWQYGIAIALALPICVTTIILSKEDIKGEIGSGTIWGILLCLLALYVFSVIRHQLASSVFLKQLLVTGLSFLVKQRPEGYLNNGELTPGHLSGFAFTVVGLLVYLVVGLIFHPHPKRKNEAPALLYIMLIIWIMTTLVGGATFYCDYYRVPAILTLILFSGLSYLIFSVDHFFRLEEPNADTLEAQLSASDFKKAINERLKDQTGERKLVVVCASGGGIQAAAWTAKVLTGLQDVFGEEFSRAIGLISSASGGSVGTLYYLDRFDLKKKCPPDDCAKSIFAKATADGLDATGWGVAYPDLWRFIGFPWLPDALSKIISKLSRIINPDRRETSALCDRGIALEMNWQGKLQNPDATLATWRKQILEGQIPIPIFNATLVEDGRRFLITPMTFKNSEKAVDFNTLYPGFNLNVATAARLSATFPYISPVCRNIHQPDKDIKDFHIADGGFFDNSGVFTIVEWLNEWLDPSKGLGIKRVLILQIKPFPEPQPSHNEQSSNWFAQLRDWLYSSLTGQQKSTAGLGWFMEFIGPLHTLYQVRNSTQLARNQAEIEILRQRWENQVPIKSFDIVFDPQEEYTPPLSWNLTKAQKCQITKTWKRFSNSSIINDIRAFWEK